MNRTALFLACLAAAALTGCAASSGFHTAVRDTPLVPATGRIEFAVNEAGGITEVEYHVSSDSVPAEIRAAAAEMFPGSPIADAEKEYHGSTLYWEVTVRKGRMSHEVMFTLKGEPYRLEIQIPSSAAPSEVLAAADRAVPGGSRTSVERILDAGETLLQYHIKKTVKGLKYKILVSPEAEVVEVLRETLAEIEVPVER